MIQQEHNDPMREPKKNFGKMKLSLAKAERTLLEKRLGKHPSIAAFARHAIQAVAGGTAALPEKFPSRPLGYRKQLLVRMPTATLSWVRAQAKTLEVSQTDFLVGMLLSFPETPADADFPRVSRNVRITTSAGRIEMKIVYIGSLLLRIQQLFHETAIPATAVEATTLLARIAEASEDIARGGNIPANAPEGNHEGGAT